MRTNRQDFEKIVNEALEDLPDAIKKTLINIAIIVEDLPKRKNSTLLGLYEGVPQNTWGKQEFACLPDKITIFKSQIESISKTRQDLKEIVKIVVWHEIAHYFGFEERETRMLERRWRKKLKEKREGKKI